MPGTNHNWLWDKFDLKGSNLPAKKKIEKTNKIKAQIQRFWGFWHLARFYDSAKSCEFFSFYGMLA